MRAQARRYVVVAALDRTASNACRQPATASPRGDSDATPTKKTKRNKPNSSTKRIIRYHLKHRTSSWPASILSCLVRRFKLSAVPPPTAYGGRSAVPAFSPSSRQKQFSGAAETEKRMGVARGSNSTGRDRVCCHRT